MCTLLVSSHAIEGWFWPNFLWLFCWQRASLSLPCCSTQRAARAGQLIIALLLHIARGPSGPAYLCLAALARPERASVSYALYAWIAALSAPWTACPNGWAKLADAGRAIASGFTRERSLFNYAKWRMHSPPRWASYLCLAAPHSSARAGQLIIALLLHIARGPNGPANHLRGPSEPVCHTPYMPELRHSPLREQRARMADPSLRTLVERLLPALHESAPYSITPSGACTLLPVTTRTKTFLVITPLWPTSSFSLFSLAVPLFSLLSTLKAATGSRNLVSWLERIWGRFLGKAVTGHWRIWGVRRAWP